MAGARLQTLHQYHRHLRPGNRSVVGRLRPFQLGRHHRRHLRLHRHLRRARFVNGCRQQARHPPRRPRLHHPQARRSTPAQISRSACSAAPPSSPSFTTTTPSASPISTKASSPPSPQKSSSCARPSKSPPASFTACPRAETPPCAISATPPIPSINMIFDKPVYNRGYDNWCPGNSFTDFIVADWTIRNQPGYKQKHKILYLLHPSPRIASAPLFLEEDDCKALAATRSLRFSETHARIQRRSRRSPHLPPRPPHVHAAPGQYTKTRLAAAHPMDRIFFGNSDSGGPESLTTEAVRLSKVGAEWATWSWPASPAQKN